MAPQASISVWRLRSGNHTLGILVMAWVMVKVNASQRRSEAKPHTNLDLTSNLTLTSLKLNIKLNILNNDSLSPTSTSTNKILVAPPSTQPPTEPRNRWPRYPASSLPDARVCVHRSIFFIFSMQMLMGRHVSSRAGSRMIDQAEPRGAPTSLSDVIDALSDL